MYSWYGTSPVIVITSFTIVLRVLKLHIKHLKPCSATFFIHGKPNVHNGSRGHTTKFRLAEGRTNITWSQKMWILYVNP
jgi:hypothetical protein